MNIAEDLWLRSQAAQQSFMQLASYNAAFMGTAALQAWQMGLTAPVGFWSAMSRASAHQSADAACGPTLYVVERDEAAPETDLVPEASEAAPDPVETAEPVLEASAVEPNPILLDAPRGGAPDDLTVLKGVGAKLQQALNEFGIYHIDQLASLNDDGIAWLDSNQPGFRMTATRYDVVAQAKALSES